MVKKMKEGDTSIINFFYADGREVQHENFPDGKVKTDSSFANSIISNFNGKVLPRVGVTNIGHKNKGTAPAFAWFNRVFVRPTDAGDRLSGEVWWTQLGIDLVGGGIYRGLSPEIFVGRPWNDKPIPGFAIPIVFDGFLLGAVGATNDGAMPEFSLDFTRDLTKNHREVIILAKKGISQETEATQIANFAEIEEGDMETLKSNLLSEMGAVIEQSITPLTEAVASLGERVGVLEEKILQTSEGELTEDEKTKTEKSPEVENLQGQISEMTKRETARDNAMLAEKLRSAKKMVDSWISLFTMKGIGDRVLTPAEADVVRPFMEKLAAFSARLDHQKYLAEFSKDGQDSLRFEPDDLMVEFSVGDKPEKLSLLDGFIKVVGDSLGVSKEIMDKAVTVAFTKRPVETPKLDEKGDEGAYFNKSVKEEEAEKKLQKMGITPKK